MIFLNFFMIIWIPSEFVIKNKNQNKRRKCRIHDLQKNERRSSGADQRRQECPGIDFQTRKVQLWFLVVCLLLAVCMRSSVKKAAVVSVYNRNDRWICVICCCTCLFIFATVPFAGGFWKYAFNLQNTTVLVHPGKSLKNKLKLSQILDEKMYKYAWAYSWFRLLYDFVNLR